jgi:hypothetical protein
LEGLLSKPEVLVFVNLLTHGLLTTSGLKSCQLASCFLAYYSLRFFEGVYEFGTVRAIYPSESDQVVAGEPSNLMRRPPPRPNQ